MPWICLHMHAYVCLNNMYAHIYLHMPWICLAYVMICLHMCISYLLLHCIKLHMLAYVMHILCISLAYTCLYHAYVCLYHSYDCI